MALGREETKPVLHGIQMGGYALTVVVLATRVRLLATRDLGRDTT